MKDAAICASDLGVNLMSCMMIPVQTSDDGKKCLASRQESRCEYYVSGELRRVEGWNPMLWKPAGCPQSCLFAVRRNGLE